MSSTKRSPLLSLVGLVGVTVALWPACGGSSGGGDGGPTTLVPPGNGGVTASGGMVGLGGAGGVTISPDGGGIATTGGGPGGAGGSMPPRGGGGIVSTGGGLAGLGGSAPGSGGSTVPACGQAGVQCCDGNGCEGGGCCVSGICMAAGGTCVGLGGGICGAGACGTCGGPGLPCCGSNPATGVCTAPGTACSAGNCTKCGELGLPCCTSTSGGTGKCNGASAICSGGLCLACGTPGTVCCPGSLCTSPGCCYESVCVAEAAACGASAGTCQAGRCSGCGRASQPCCSGSTCYDGLLCKGGACTPCGGVGQSCCPTTGGAAACQAGTACSGSGSDGVCARCGTPGDICCAGSTCTEGCCWAGRCLAPSSCATPDGGQTDAPLGGTGGTGGTTVVGSGGVAGTGGTTTGGAGGTTTPWTLPPGCGDGVVAATERCDDGNTLPFDGCSSDCQNEPVCGGSGPCTSRCGDGIVLGEACDDGNTAPGDGCSATCTVEGGFTCTQPPLGDRILVPVIYRDFKFQKPTDFEAGVTGSSKASTGMVKLDLDSDGKPGFTGLTGSGIHVASQDTFATWYRNTEGVNHPTPSKLTLWDNGAGAYVNRYGGSGEQWPTTKKAYWCGYVGTEDRGVDGQPIPCTYRTDAGLYQTECDLAVAQGLEVIDCRAEGDSYSATIVVNRADGNPLFFPVDGDAFTPPAELYGAQIPPFYDASSTWPYDVDGAGTKRLHNFSFTTEVRYWFKYEADTSYRLNIVGDDDVWVFVNRKLAVDLGGIHTPVEGSVIIDSASATTFGLTPGNVYEVAVFQAERQTTSSTFKITLSGFNLAPSACYPN